MDSTRLDHGALSIPNRTRNIDRDLDRYTRGQAAKRKAERKATSERIKEKSARAKALLKEWESAILARHGERFGRATLREELRSKAHWEPEWLLAFAEKFIAEDARSDNWERENL